MQAVPRMFVVGALALSAVLSLGGCTVATSMATASADAKQKPPVTDLSSSQPADRVFNAAVLAMGSFGKTTAQDRASGLIQGERGNWVMSAEIAPQQKGSRIQLSARYVPSKRMDFSSREDLTREFVSLLESRLGEKLAHATP